ncbi:MAG: DUF3783 domain-containing protein [Lachnospiraceae bacterium]|nr:DUF3783 domain-containing protein [Lachnospiraceae bacterium]
MEPLLLLYNFTEEEQKEWELALKPVSVVRKKFVDKKEFGIPIYSLLSEEAVPTFLYQATEDFDGRMVLIANVTANTLFQYLLAVSKMVTKEPVYRAVLTETNRDWTSSFLFYHLKEEEAEIKKRRTAEG